VTARELREFLATFPDDLPVTVLDETDTQCVVNGGEVVAAWDEGWLPDAYSTDHGYKGGYKGTPEKKVGVQQLVLCHSLIVG
jgi:hypothetical protein